MTNPIKWEGQQLTISVLIRGQSGYRVNQVLEIMELSSYLGCNTVLHNNPHLFLFVTNGIIESSLSICGIKSQLNIFCIFNFHLWASV